MIPESEAGSSSAVIAKPKTWNPFLQRDFFMLWVGETVSILGTQFNLVALPWMVLGLTGSGLTLGTIMMVAGVPRAVLMMIGGGVADKFSPRALMLISNIARAFIVGCLAALVWAHSIRVESVLILVFLFGVADAFFYPAYMAIVPRIVEKGRIAQANSLLQSSAQLMILMGPALAGLIIGANGLAQAFTVDSLSFIFAFFLILLISRQQRSDALKQTGILASVAEGLRYTWSDGLLRGCIFVTAMTNFGFIGPFTLGTALLAHQRFGSATSLGVMLSASGGGALLGAIAAGVFRPAKRRGLVMLMFPVSLGAGLIGLALAPDLVTASIVRAMMGVLIGFMNVFATTLLQNHVTPAMLGRVMGVVTLGMFGLQPISYLLAGAVAQFGTPAVFLTASGLLFGGSLLASLIPEMRRFQ